ncbi:APC family permease [Streptomyces sp. HGB0020]|uniref:APC family permease n=1 Tax=Streptomyces sp. HGB0020 TaxID=1078086 RepID=UPI00034E44C9|nr:APC family permease [Streptomyces sp. HGB0020]EPD69471.1 hypothetical protein HMPREF1211_00017 [Streptomyces sp. HGB0020]
MAEQVAERAGSEQASGNLRGNLGVASIVFTVLAFNAPLGTAAGFVPVLIGYGNQDGAPSTFIVVAVVLTLFSVGLMAMSRYMSSPGAFYSYIVAGLGRIPGLGAAFTAFGAYTAFCLCSYAYGGIVANAMVHGLFHGPDISWWIYSLVMWVVSTILSMLHMELSARVLGVALVAEVVLVLLWGLRVFFNGAPEGVSLHPFTVSAFTSGSLPVGLLFGALCITGFEAVAVFRKEARDPVRTVKRATYGSVAVMCGLYAFTAWADLTAYGHTAVQHAAADPSGSFVSSVHTYVGSTASDLVTVLLVSSVFASIPAVQSIAARYLYTLGSDGVLPRSLGRIHTTQGSPYVAAAWFSALCLIGIIVPAITGLDPLRVYSSCAAIGSVCLVVLMFATSLAILTFFHRDSTHTATRLEAQVAPALALVGIGGVLYLAITHMPDIIGAGRTAADLALAFIVLLAVAGAGLASYLRAQRPEIFARIGRQDL